MSTFWIRSMLWCLSMTALVTGEISSQENQSRCSPGEVYSESLENCCRTCEPGFGMALPCTRENTTKCEPCRPGETYSFVLDHVEGCQPCAQCPSNAHETHKCNTTHNTVCECNSGYYYRRDNVCTRCSECKPGHGVARRCGRLGNTVCQPCVAGITFSVTSSDVDKCQSCTPCLPNQYVVSHCTMHRDTTCQDMMEEHIGNHTYTRRPVSDDMDMVKYVVPLGFIIAFLLYYVLHKHFSCLPWFPRWFCCHREKKQSPSCASSYEAGPLIEAQRDSGVYPSRSKRSKGSTNGQLPVNSLLHHTLFESEIINPLNRAENTAQNWRALGTKLGYSDQYLESIDGKSPAWSLIKEWSKEGRGTVAKLKHYLTAIGRSDLATKVDQLSRPNLDIDQIPRPKDHLWV